jgi:hypothetical protein
MSIALPEIRLEKIKDISKAKGVITLLMRAVESLSRHNRKLVEQIQTLEEKIAKLEGRPCRPQFDKKNYSPTKRLKKKKKRWSKSKKKDSIKVDKVVALYETDVCECGNDVFKVLRTVEKLIQNIIIRRNNILYKGRDKQCSSCGKIHKAQIPTDIKGVEFGGELRSWISYLRYECRMTEGLIHQLLTGMEVKISKGEVSHIILTNSKKLISAYTWLKVWGIKLSKYLQTDGTGWKRKSKITGKIINHHLHFVGHKLLSIFAITRKYNSTTVSKLLGKRGLLKSLISDDASCYGNKLLAEIKQLCWYHEIKHYLKLNPRFTIHKQKRKKIINKLWSFYYKAKEYGHNPTPKVQKELEKLFDTVTAQKTGYAQLDHRLILTGKKKDRLLKFLKYPWLPIHNNQSEQDIRDGVMIRQISRESKSQQGDKSLARHLSVLQTAKKQGLCPFATLHGLLTGELSLTVLTAKRL